MRKESLGQRKETSGSLQVRCVWTCFGKKEPLTDREFKALLGGERREIPVNDTLYKTLAGLVRNMNANFVFYNAKN